MEPSDIWNLILKADDALKYATEEKATARRGQAAKLLQEALREAEAVGNVSLADQASKRLSDLGELPDA